jgi:hypothetical protein
MGEKVELVAGERGLALTTIEEMYRFAQYCVKSGIVPHGDTPEAVVVKIQAARELGITPMRGLQSLYVVNGRVAMMEKLAVALVVGSGILATNGQIEVSFSGKEYEDDFTCTVRSRRRDQDRHNVTTFSVKDAKLARLWEKKSERGVSPWVAYPKRMLAARAKQHHFQDFFGDVTMGLATAESAVDDDVIVVAGRSVRGALEPATEVTVSAAGADPLFAVPGSVTEFDHEESARLDAELSDEESTTS